MDCKTRFLTFAVLSSLIQLVLSFTELPKFSQLLLLYPGYPHSGGEYHNRDLLQHILGMTATERLVDLSDTLQNIHSHNTASLRMSWTLNRYSGRHGIGTQPIYLSHEGRDSITGKDGQEYIFRNTAFGPFLAEKYGNPTAIMLDPLHHEPNVTTEHFKDKQGVIRFISYHKDHAGGHIALWDCDHFHQSKDWSTEHHIISVEFWESPDSYCPPKLTGPTASPKLVTLKPGTNVKAIAQQNFKSMKTHSNSDLQHAAMHGNRHHDTDSLPKEEDSYHSRKQKLRHKTERRRLRRLKHRESMWLQEET